MSDGISPLPWSGHRATGKVLATLADANGKLVTIMKTEIKSEDLDLIVKACNSHKTLVTALRDIAAQAYAASKLGNADALMMCIADIERTALAASRCS